MPLVLSQIQAGMEKAWLEANKAGRKAGKDNLEHIKDGGDHFKMPVSAATIEEAQAEKFGEIAGLEIDKYIKSADVLPGIAVATAGTAASQIGSTTAIGKIA